jgi:acetylglutamate kinase
VGGGPAGESLNVNADEAALAIAVAVRAGSLVYLSDVDGVKVGDRVLARLDEDEAQARIDDGTIAGGMSLKVRAALEAARAGVEEVVVAGKARLTGGFPGTAVTARRKAQAAS